MLVLARYQVGIRTESKILEATRDLLAEGGLDAATLKAICERAGVQAGSFYNIFPSKEQAVMQVAREAIQAVDPDPELSGSETLDDLVDAYIRFVVDQSDLARVYLQVAVSGSIDDSVARRFLRHHVRRVERFADAMVRESLAADPEEATTKAEVLLGALDGLAFRWVLDRSFDFTKHAGFAVAQCSR
ncbi:MAG TPA: TetR/AcrR family transcriptional regulator [Acidimicrobiia bacterium]|nr:TetR/AcrR family transcriptional regulator [Acidimicrobiia bacterium]